MRRYFGLTLILAIIISSLGASSANANGCSVAQTGTVVTGRGTCSGDITIPDGATSIGSFAFQSSTITSVIIPNSVTSIDDYAFYDSREIRTVTIGNGVTSIGVNAFATNIALTTVTFAADSALTSIGADAFYVAQSLTSITIPSGVTSIGDNAFFSARALATVRFLGNTAPSVGVTAFRFAPVTARAIVISTLAKNTFTPIVDGKWEGLRLVTSTEADAEDAAASAESVAIAAAAARAQEIARAATAARAQEIARAAAVELAKTQVINTLNAGEPLTSPQLDAAEIIGSNLNNVKLINNDIAQLAPLLHNDLTVIKKIVRKYQIIGIIASPAVNLIYSNLLIEINLIPADYKYKSSVTASLKKTDASDRSNLLEISDCVTQSMLILEARQVRLEAANARYGGNFLR